MKSTLSKNKKRGIEISRWKVEDADDFTGMVSDENYGIEPLSREIDEAAVNAEDDKEDS